MNETDYNARLYEKMKAEQDRYRDWLLHQEPVEILNHTYEWLLLVISRTLIINVPKITNPWIIVGANMVFTLGVSMLIIEILSKNKLGRFILGE